MAEHLADRGVRVVLVTGISPGDAAGAAEGACAEIAACLRERCGVPGERISSVIISGSHDREAVMLAVDREAGMASGPLLIWYSGPALPDATGRLCLGPGGAVPFAEIDACLAARRWDWPTVVILDCPHSSQAQLASPEWGLLTSEAPGTPVQPTAPRGHGLTAQLIRLLREGIPDGPPEISLQFAYGQVVQVMAPGGQIPGLRCGQRLGLLVLAPNLPLRPLPGTTRAGAKSSVPSRRRRIDPAWAVAITLAIAAVATVLTTALASASAHGPGGASSPAVPPSRAAGQATTAAPALTPSSAAGQATTAAPAPLTPSPAAGQPTAAAPRTQGPGLPVLYNLGGGLGSVWDNPEVTPSVFYVTADGSAAIGSMRWTTWNDSAAVTGSATYYDRTGPCCTSSDQHYYKVTVTLSDVRQSGGPDQGHYYSRMVITGPGFSILTYIYHVFGSSTGAWIMGAP
jgi:hypothetical protein